MGAWNDEICGIYVDDIAKGSPALCIGGSWEGNILKNDISLNDFLTIYKRYCMDMIVILIYN